MISGGLRQPATFSCSLSRGSAGTPSIEQQGKGQKDLAVCRIITIFAARKQTTKQKHMVKISKEAALQYHEAGRPGKIEVKPTTAYRTQTDLSLAYSPGVAYPCLEIQQNPDDAYRYTDKGNLVAVISNGTAVLGLGDIGAMSGKPVMEGKGLLFKI